MIFPSIQNLHPKIIIQKQPETRGIPPLPAAVLFLLDFILSGLTPALLRPYSVLVPSLFLDIIPDYTIQIKTQDTKH